MQNSHLFYIYMVRLISGKPFSKKIYQSFLIFSNVLLILLPTSTQRKEKYHFSEKNLPYPLNIWDCPICGWGTICKSNFQTKVKHKMWMIDSCVFTSSPWLRFLFEWLLLMSLNYSSIERLKSVFSQLKSCLARTLLICVPDFVVDVFVIVSYKTSLKIMGILKFGYRVPWTNQNLCLQAMVEPWWGPFSICFWDMGCRNLWISQQWHDCLIDEEKSLLWIVKLLTFCSSKKKEKKVFQLF